MRMLEGLRFGARQGIPHLTRWLLRVTLRHSQPCPECLLLGVKQTSISGGWMSACSHKTTYRGFSARIDSSSAVR